MAKKPKKSSTYAQFSTMGIQMGIIIGGFTWLGVFLDEKYPNKYGAYTICFALLGVFISMYILIKEVMKMNKDNEE